MHGIYDRRSLLFCRQPSGTEDIHEAATFQIDSRVQAYATLLEDTKLLDQLSLGDMVALQAKYHTNCLARLYNHARKAKSEGPKDTDQEPRVSAIVFAELLLYIEETRLDEETEPVFKLADLVQLYQSRMEQLEVSIDTRVHSTSLKQRLIAQFPDMQAHNKGRDVLMVFEEDVGTAFATACGLDCDSNAVHLARAAQIVQCQMFREAKTFNGFPERCQEESVPLLLLGLVCVILMGPSIKKTDGRHNPCNTCTFPNIEVQQQHQAQADTWHIISQRQTQHCTGDTSSNILRDNVACSHMQVDTNRQAVTPGY